MLQKYLSENKIFWISIIIVLAGLVSPFIIFEDRAGIFEILGHYIKSFLEIVNVSMIGLESQIRLDIPRENRGILSSYNVLNLFIYILLLLGAIFYKVSKGKETRFLRYIFSIIFLSKFLGLITAIIFFFVYLEHIRGIFFLHTFVGLIMTTAHLLLAFGILKYLEGQKILDAVTKQYGEKESIVLIETSKWTRFFHHLMDNLTMLLVLSPIVMNMIRIPNLKETANSLSNFFGDRPTIMLFIMIWRVIYYFSFEATLGITSAKLLSETRVVDEDGNKPSVGKIAVRTLLRIVPFEAFTFFMHSGLHDRSSQTYVVNEKRTGVKGSRYFLIIPIFLILGFSIWYGIEKYEEAKFKRIYEAEEKLKKEEFLEKIKTLSTNDILTLKAINYDHKGIFLKAESIENDLITFVILDSEKDYKPYFGENYTKYQAPDLVEKIYEIEKKNPETIRLSKAQIIKANEVTGEEYYEKKNGLKVLGKQFEIAEIESYFGPRLSVSLSSDYSEQSEIVLQNIGWPVDIISVSKFKVQYGKLPFTLNKQNYNNVVLVGEKGENFDFEIKVKDTLNRISSYKISKKEELEPTIKKIK